MFVWTENRDSSIVVELNEFVAPEQKHGYWICEQRVDQNRKCVRPFCKRAQRSPRPVVARILSAISPSPKICAPSARSGSVCLGSDILRSSAGLHSFHARLSREAVGKVYQRTGCLIRGEGSSKSGGCDILARHKKPENPSMIRENVCSPTDRSHPPAGLQLCGGTVARPPHHPGRSARLPGESNPLWTDDGRNQLLLRWRASTPNWCATAPSAPTGAASFTGTWSRMETPKPR